MIILLLVLLLLTADSVACVSGHTLIINILYNIRTSNGNPPDTATAVVVVHTEPLNTEQEDTFKR